MKTIRCHCGKDIWVEDENYERIIDFSKSWHCGGMAVRTSKGGVRVSITWLIMKIEPGQVVDHIDHNIHNNLKSNLRIASNRQNMWNVGKLKNNTSGYKNVHKRKGGAYEVQVHDENGKQQQIGTYETGTIAAEHADMAMLRFHGEFAFLNFPHRKEEYVCRMEVKQRTGKEYLI